MFRGASQGSTTFSAALQQAGGEGLGPRAGVPAGARHAKLRFSIPANLTGRFIVGSAVLGHQGRDHFDDLLLLTAREPRHIFKYPFPKPFAREDELPNSDQRPGFRIINPGELTSANAIASILPRVSDPPQLVVIVKRWA